MVRPMAVKMSTPKSDKRSVSLVTGATSGLGRALINRLISRGDEVRAIIRSQPKEHAEWKKLPPGVVPYVSDLTFRSADDEKNLKSACRGVDSVFHIAGGTYNSTLNYDQLVEINVIGTENLLKCVADSCESSDKRIHFIYPSSITVYGYRRRGEMISESTDPRPGSPYSETKLMAEHTIQSYANEHSCMFYTILRLGTLYGRGYEQPSFFKAFRLIKSGKMRYIGSGNNHLTLAHVSDAADAAMLAADKPKISENKVYNITDGKEHTPKELFTMVANFMGVKPPSKSINPAIARLMVKAVGLNYDEYEFLASDRVVDISKAKRELGYSPVRRLDVDGLAMAEAFLASHKA